MNLVQIVQRSLSGYIFVVPGLLLYFGRLKKEGKKQTPAHVTCTFIFCFYLIGVLTMTGIGRIKAFSPRISLIPFADMIDGLIDTVLNVILFLPFGFFLPLMYKKYNCISKTALTGLLLSVSIEVIQMFGRGATDINDLITNMLGACLGFFVYQFLSGLIGKELCRKFKAGRINEGKEVLLFIIYSFVVMVTIQPFIIHTLFQLG